jgi:hypothetical protein
MSDEPATLRKPPKVVVGADARYTYLQKLVGGVAFAFPILVVFVGQWLDDGAWWRTSISAYYYSRTGNVFVGSLCALAIFFFSYEYPLRQGFRLDRLLSCVAGLMAIGVALFPTPSDGASASGRSDVVGWIHMTCASVLFTMLATLSLWFFTKSNRVKVRPTFGENVQMLVWCPAKFRTPLPIRKRRRNFTYRICGRVIFVSMAIMAYTVLQGWVDHWFLIFECIAVFAFGASWLIKGDAVPWFKDEPEPNRS